MWLLQLPPELSFHAASFLRLDELLTLYSVCRGARALFAPDAAVWKDMRHQLHDVAVYATAPVLQLLNQIYAISSVDIGINDLTRNSVLCAAAARGDTDKMRWLMCRFLLSADIVRSAAAFAVMGGRLDALQMLVGAQTPANQPGLIYELVWLTTRMRRLQMLSWLAAVMRYSMPMGVFMVFQHLCRGAWVAAAAFASGAAISGSEVRMHENAFLGQACVAGQLHTANWLIDIYAITWQDLARNDYATLRGAAARPFAIKWLIAKLHITRKHLRAVGLSQLIPRRRKKSLYGRLRRVATAATGPSLGWRRPRPPSRGFPHGMAFGILP